jgi:hypothetical protein
MSPPEVRLDLLKLLKALGYLEGARWQDTRDRSPEPTQTCSRKFK